MKLTKDDRQLLSGMHIEAPDEFHPDSLMLQFLRSLDRNQRLIKQRDSLASALRFATFVAMLGWLVAILAVWR